jgi:1,4-dihydroxy-2-naphthoate octaprenyltransferase
VTTVILGKHLDNFPYDQPRGVRTLAVRLGEPATNRLIRAMMLVFYLVCLGLVLAGVLSVWVLLVLASLPRLRRVWKISHAAEACLARELRGLAVVVCLVGLLLTKLAGRCSSLASSWGPSLLLHFTL